MSEPTISRRELIRNAAGVAVAGAAPASLLGLAPSAHADDPPASEMALPRDRRSLILYTVRDRMTSPDGTREILDEIAARGFKGLEMANNTGGLTPEQFRAEVESRGMYLVGDHAGQGSMRGSNRPAAIERAATLGLPRVGTGSYDNPQNVDGYKAAAEEMNEFGQALRAEIPGCRWYCHLHSFEWTLITDANNSGQPEYNGRRLIEIWFEELDPQYAFIEVDIAWAWRALGEATVDYVAEYQDAIEYFHVKDVAGTEPNSPDVDYGDGVVDFEAIYEVLRDPAAHQFIAERDGSTDIARTLDVFGEHLRTVRLDRSVVGAPANLAAPALAGTGAAGDEQAAEHGSWTRADGATYSYRWLDEGGLPIPGATARTYTPTPEQVGSQVSVEVKATTAAGSTVAESAPVVVAPPGEDPADPPGPSDPGPSDPGPGDEPPQAPGRMSVGRLRRNRRRGTATVAVSVTGAGTLALAGKGVAARTLELAGPDRVRVPIEARGKARRRLRREGSARVRPRLTFTPAFGQPQSDSFRVKLVRERRRRR